MKSIIGYLIFIVLSLSILSCGNESPVTFLDYSNNLDEKVDTIEITYIAWACACANWINTDYFGKNPNYMDTDYSKDCFFIEAENKENKLPEKYHSNNRVIRLIGSFYKDKGISRDYIKPTSQKPEKSRVFRYSKYETIGNVGKTQNGIVDIKENEHFDFKQFLSEIDLKITPFIESSNFDNVVINKNYYLNSDQFDSFKLDQIYEQETDLISYISYRINFSSEFNSLVFLVYKGEHELETILVNYDLDWNLIDYKIIAYDEIAESVLQSSSEIGRNEIIVTERINYDKEQVNINKFDIKENGKIMAVANNK